MVSFRLCCLWNNKNSQEKNWKLNYSREKEQNDSYCSINKFSSFNLKSLNSIQSTKQITIIIHACLASIAFHCVLTVFFSTDNCYTFNSSNSSSSFLFLSFFPFSFIKHSWFNSFDLVHFYSVDEDNEE